MTYTKPKPLRLAHVPGGDYICERHNDAEGGPADDFAYDDHEHECAWEAEDSPCADLDDDWTDPDQGWGRQAMIEDD